MPVSPSTQHHLDAATGWLELGNPVEAHNELEQLPHSERIHPTVLKLRCRIYRQAAKWEYLSILAESCYKARPEEAQFVVDWAWAEYKQGRREQAAVILQRESEKFPKSDAVAYHLACVLASLDRMAEARDWLAKAFERAREPDKLKLRALEEAEFKKLWQAA